MSTGEKVNVSIKVTLRDERTLHKIKRIAMMHGGFPISLSPQRQEGDLQKSGTCVFQFSSQEKANKFKADLSSHISDSRARPQEY